MRVNLLRRELAAGHSSKSDLPKESAGCTRCALVLVLPERAA